MCMYIRMYVTHTHSKRFKSTAPRAWHTADWSTKRREEKTKGGNVPQNTSILHTYRLINALQQLQLGETLVQQLKKASMTETSCFVNDIHTCVHIYTYLLNLMNYSKWLIFNITEAHHYQMTARTVANFKWIAKMGNKTEWFEHRALLLLLD